MSKQIVIFPKGSISPKDKERMSKEGYLAIEAEDPSRVVLQLPSGVVSGDALLLCALNAMSAITSNGERAKFTELLTKHLNKGTQP